MKHIAHRFFPIFLFLGGCVTVEDNTWDARPDSVPDPVSELEVRPDADGETSPEGVPESDVPGEGEAHADLDAPADPDFTPDTVDVDISPDLPAEPDVDSTPCYPLEGGSCNAISNCNCAAGEKCSIFLDPADSCNIIEECAAATGSLPTGSSCDPASDQCAVGNVCLTDSSTGSNTCYRWCDDDTDCSGGMTCTVEILVTLDCGDYTLLYRGCGS